MKEEIQADIDKYAALGTVSLAEGGQLLVKTFTEDIVSTLKSLAQGYRVYSHVEMIALCASIESKLDTIHAITRAPGQETLAKEALERAIQR